MTARARKRIALALIAMAIAAIAFTQLLRPLRDASDFLVPSTREADAARAAFGLALAGEEMTPVGLRQARRAEDADILVLEENEGGCAGRGLYQLRTVAAVPLALVAPHRGADRHTGTIVRDLFEEQDFAAAAWNSAPRRADDTCAGGDVAREETHYITAFSRAFAGRYPGGRIIQVHGFERARRATAAARNTDIIVSDGTDEPGERLLDVADCLSTRLAPLRVAVYPYDASELGALNNAQGRALREDGFTGFVHLELAPDLRRRLTSERPLRDTLAACLAIGLA